MRFLIPLDEAEVEIETKSQEAEHTGGTHIINAVIVTNSHITKIS